MKNFKGTKGEWFPNVISTITIGVNAEINKKNEGVYSQNVCEFILPDTDEEYEKERLEIESNAKLIAAAPEMLEALIGLAFRMNEQLSIGNIKHNKDHAERDLMIAQQAIKKAL